MSLALAMVLVAAMTVPGNGPKKMSGEMEQRLDLSGEWEGTSRTPPRSDCVVRVRFVRDKATIYDPSTRGSVGLTVIDDGGGRLRIPFREGSLLGIYCYQDRDNLHICFGTEIGHRPTSFQAGNGQCLLILHRVKRQK